MKRGVATFDIPEDVPVGEYDLWLVPEGDIPEDGKSAYELAVEEGFVGTLEEWLASLVGPPPPNVDGGTP